ncbi:hypothetical protein G5B40_12110 [Pikeienuella piscinae]|uniref:Uncharacterized protein n=1 Tax=Pikeienuella piscinae TaxID=2748098 RepID=A0A7L5C050_9RHOB|nr:hypothetical protein [Pikeienuella piscinae]QIE56137.1 hypothetical protein G5B40_12110 [Pikeienuella piscinae]
MSFIVDLARKPPKMEDIAYFLGAALSRPGDIPWILRREAAKRRAGRAADEGPDTLGLRGLTRSWEAALAGGVFRAPPGTGARLTVTRSLTYAPLSIVSALQTAGGVTFLDLVDDPAFPALSLEAARLGLPQAATDPERAKAARLAFIETAELSEPLRSALRQLANEPIRAA